ncbi:glycosyltransferase [Acinetobacter indicus]|uniref:glycosyltransferase n=1 Tax=Acinetobacter indicus TaxID=756892 RepID=UPI000CEB3E41|nr:glycosyltransferase [Acinetobacter indicus]AVH15439.1 glycosyltransferase [Acinetobacter indicus]
MKIAHLCLSCFYYDGFSYQENLLPRQNVVDGHETIIIASTESIDKQGKITFLGKDKYQGSDGCLVYRVPYSKSLPPMIRSKVRSYEGVYEILKDFKPDVVYFHGISAYELLVLKKYKRLNPDAKIIVDVHSDANNSGTNWISKYFLHKFFYRSIFQMTLPVIDKIFCISMECMDFAIEEYGAPKEKTEFYPLGGECLEDDEYNVRRKNMREKLNINDEKILILQTGKINKKKKAVEALSQFIQVKNDKFRYVIAGSLEEDVKDDIMDIIKTDERIKYVGWVDSNEMKDYLCASDLYMQPGSQSATMQQSLCLRNSVIIDNVKSHKPFVNENGWLIDDISDISDILKKISCRPEIINDMSQKSYQLSLELLSYKKLANRIYLKSL